MKYKDSYVPEFTAVFAVASLLIFGSALYYFVQAPSLPPPLTENPSQYAKRVKEVTVRLEGAVKNPGSYRIPKGTTLDQAIKRADPLALADLRRFKLDRKIHKPEKITIRELPMVTLFLQGAVDRPGQHRFLKGTTTHDLREMDLISASADLSPLKRKRKLKDGEVLFFPKVN